MYREKHSLIKNWSKVSQLFFFSFQLYTNETLHRYLSRIFATYTVGILERERSVYLTIDRFGNRPIEKNKFFGHIKNVSDVDTQMCSQILG